MNMTRRGLLTLLGMGGMSASLAGCGQQTSQGGSADQTEQAADAAAEPQVDLNEFADLAIDMDMWLYDEQGDCYYQLALPYCLTPGSEQYESLSIYVPGPYFEATPKGRHFSCVVAQDAKVGSFTPATAPVAMPINSYAYAAQDCPSTYAPEGLATYLGAGMVYVYAGFRGRSGGYESTTQEYFCGGAPWPVADLKAAVRYLRYNAAALPFDASRVFLFGLGGGGGIAQLMGVSGNAAVYEPYLGELGVATHDAEGNVITDEVCGIASWCSLASFESADAAYEWMMGQYASKDTRAEGTWTKLLSKDLADAYGDYVNGLGLVDGEGTELRLDRIEDGSYGGGSYYDHLVGIIASSAEDFFSRTSFPFAAVPLQQGVRLFPGNPAQDEGADLGQSTQQGTTPAAPGVRQVEATVYETIESYVSTLNGDSRWLTYNADTGQVDVTGLWGFVRACRQPDKDVCAYDLQDRSGLANQLFGTDAQPSLHFDPMVARLVEGKQGRYAKAQGWDEKVVSEWRGDMVEVDALEKTVEERVGMSDPLAFLKSAAQDEQATGIAPHWRINTGLFQSETTLVGELNLACALAAHKDVSDVAFQAVWNAGFELAEREGDAEERLVEWICSCCPAPKSKKKADEKEKS